MRWEEELGRYDWPTIACGCEKSGAHLPQDIREFLDAAPSASTGSLAEDVVENHAVIQSTAYESSVPVVRVLMTAATESSDVALREQIYRAVLSVVSCDAQEPEFSDEWPPLVTESRAIVEGMKEVVYTDLLGEKSPLALLILEYSESDDDRLRGCYTAIRSDLPGPYNADEYRLFARRDEGW